MPARTRLHSLVAEFRDLPRPFWVLFAGTFVNRVGGFVLIFLAIYLTEARRLTPAQEGAVIAAYGIGHQDQDLYEWWRSDAFAARRQETRRWMAFDGGAHSCNRPPADQFGTG